MQFPWLKKRKTSHDHSSAKHHRTVHPKKGTDGWKKIQYKMSKCNKTVQNKIATETIYEKERRRTKRRERERENVGWPVAVGATSIPGLPAR